MKRLSKLLWISLVGVYFCNFNLYGQNAPLKGVIVDEQSGLGVSNVNIVDINTKQYSISDSLGRFVITNKSYPVHLQFTKVGYLSVTKEFSYSNEVVKVSMTPSLTLIDEVEINNGYQWIPKERATGSYVHVDSELLERVPGRSIIDRLDGIMPGLQFDKRETGPMSEKRSMITSRGMTGFSILGSAPLVILDNFPFEGDIEAINPEDVESVTLLRDAAATSIWGARAGNGVIVINLKRPEKTGTSVVSWSSSLSVMEKPDLFYQPTMSSQDFVDVELFLYDQNYYRSSLQSSNAWQIVFSPVVQAKYDFEKGKITENELMDIISESRVHDYRDELMKYYYKKSLNQRHQFSLSNSVGKHSMRLSAGFDQKEGNRNFAIGNQKNHRYSFTFFNNYDFSDRLKASLNIVYSYFDDPSTGGEHYPFNPLGGKAMLYPYAKLVDGQGEYLQMPLGFNTNFVDTVGGGKLLDWRYIPFDYAKSVSRNAKTTKITPTFILNYNPWKSLSIDLTYSIDNISSKTENLDGENSYIVRNNVNRFTEIVGSKITHHFPKGGINTLVNSDERAQKARLNAKMSESIFGNDQLSWIFGGEVSDLKQYSTTQKVIGYDDYFATAAIVNHATRYPLYFGGTASIGSGNGFSRNIRRFLSVFGNASYIYDKKYIISGSIRRDASNVFGVKSNERWNPLWSIGLAWNLQQEPFLKDVSWISSLKLRWTQGHSGNLGGGTTSDRVIIRSMPAPSSYPFLSYAIITAPPNTSLKWEDVRMNNYAIDFSLFAGRIAGNIDYYRKKVTDLIANDILDPTTGFSSMSRNVAEIQGEGVDVSLNYNVLRAKIRWTINSSVSFVTDKVTNHFPVPTLLNGTFVSYDNVVRPIIGKPLISVYSYKFAGLDPVDGSPLGIVNGTPSKDYVSISRDSFESLNYHGSARPLYHGFLNNNLSFRSLSLSFVISFKGGHYYKGTSIDYGNLFDYWSGHKDFDKRWKESGDEMKTNVPSMIYPADRNRDRFYANSEANIHKADIIRFQQVYIQYEWTQKILHMKKISIGLHSDNVGIIWKASKGDRDPDYFSIPPSRTFNASVNLKF